MPLKTGFECLEEIMSSATVKDAVVIKLTTCGHHADIEKLYAADANFFIIKPTDFTVLCEVLKKTFIEAERYSRLQPHKNEFVLSA